jgi:NADPH-dependent glutamate synthase beta subunit-like oxidoreductase
MGYGAAVFEALPVLGGMLRVGIPEYRLPKKILEAEIDQILELGVTTEINTRLGVDFQLKDLKEYAAVFLALGNHVSKRLGISGEEDWAMSGVEFLRSTSLGKGISLGKRVVIIGGGNTAIDAARTALRMGAKPSILYRRTREEMPAFPAEIHEAEEEGIDISFLVSPVGLIVENGQKKLECVKNRLGPPDEDGRRRPVEVKGSNYFLDVDHVLTAIGEDADLAALPKKIGIQDSIILTDERGATKQEGVFAGGDITHQPHTVVHAIGSGKRAAIFIDCMIRNQKWEGVMDAIRIGERGSLSMRRYLQDEGEREPRSSKTVRLQDLNLDYFEPKKRKKTAKAAMGKRLGTFEEVNLGFPEETAIDEAKRCFNCGVCNLCDNCFIFCPDVAIRKENGNNVIDYDHCKGCGICVEECPRDAMIMEEEGK